MAPKKSKAARKPRKSARTSAAENQQPVEEQHNQAPENNENQAPTGQEEAMIEDAQQENRLGQDINADDEQGNMQDLTAEDMDDDDDATNEEKGKQAGSSKGVRGRKKGGKPQKKNYNDFHTYIYKVLKEVHPGQGISAKGMSVMNTFAVDMLERIAKEAQQLAVINKKRTITSREIASATKFVLPGELAKHAGTEGAKAVVNFSNNK